MPDTAKALRGEPWTPGLIVVCADDYGAEDKTSAVIRDLVGRGRLNAATCLVEGGGWAEEGSRLAALAAATPGVQVGLHLNLTERLAHVADPGMISPIAVHLAQALLPASAAREQRIGLAFRAQWDRFVAGFGRPPDFIDGHEHVHLFIGPRRALFRLARDVGFSGWMRQCETTSGRGGLKGRVLDPFSRAFRREATARDLPTNPAFGGLRRFDPREDVEALWRGDVAAMGAGGLLMVHPGGDDDSSAGRCRAQEASLLAEGRLAAVLAGQRAKLGP
ncbi:MAG TPA: ChbG/HpnK family deacetylase [Caulobacteraceae bacterium]|nr:ChbG/HpnK family deacetylase [Caulobacteraceae bacterium]